MKKTKPTKQPPAISPDQAFVKSAAHLFAEMQLEPYTPSRVVAAQAMGLKYPRIGSEGLACYEKTGLYPGELRDIIIVLGVCRLPKEEVLSAQLDPVAAYNLAEEWASGLGLTDMSSDIFKEAQRLFEALQNEIGASKTERKGTDSATGSASDDDPND